MPQQAEASRSFEAEAHIRLMPLSEVLHAFVNYGFTRISSDVNRCAAYGEIAWMTFNRIGRRERCTNAPDPRAQSSLSPVRR